MQNKIEILAPVGSYETLAAAIKAGCDSIYFGIEQLNMRSRAANNFTLEDLKKITSICKKNKVKAYVTLNTVMYDHDANLIKRICDACKDADVDAVIASDLAVIPYARGIGLNVHASTQMNICNIEAVKFWSEHMDVMILARELTLQQIKHICTEIEAQQIKGPSGNLVKIEIFVHGALCVAISGKCYMSIATYNASANRGACLQNCRRPYKLIDEETGEELKVDNKYIMSPKDMNTIGFIDKIARSGVSIFKIEGRGKGPDYVQATVRSYKEAVEAVRDNTYSREKVDMWNNELAKVYNRGFWEGGYYLGKKLGEWSSQSGSQATRTKVFVGLVENYYDKAKAVLINIVAKDVKVGDQIMITGPTTGIVKSKIENIRLEESDLKSAKKGQSVSIPVKDKVRENDKVYLIDKNNP
jgi:putative protease